MDGSPRSPKRRRLNSTTRSSPAITSVHDHHDGVLDKLPAAELPSDTVEHLAQTPGTLNGIHEESQIDVYEDEDELQKTASNARRSGRRGKVDYAALNGVKSGKVMKNMAKTSKPQSRRKTAPAQGTEPEEIHTPSKRALPNPQASTPLSGDQYAAVQNISHLDDDGSPPPSLTPSRRNRVWPRQYTNRGLRENALAQKTPDAAVASPQAMLGRLASAGKAVAPRFRLGVNGVEPVQEQGISLRDLDLANGSGTIVVKRKQAPAPSAALRIEESEQGMLRSIVLEKLTGKRPIPLIGLDDEYKKVYQVAEQTVTAGEGNSMLVIGARGSGKTTMMNKVVREIARNNMSDFHVIRLNGFIHTDDRLALREIWRQLGREMEVEDDGTGKTYADTLARLLALLSHPSELLGEPTESIAKAVIFVMDEFDLFASHPRQTLLYNLFDIAQSRKAPIAVFGLTTRIDVAESLEKRVKSRFSHRYVHLCQAPNLPGFVEVCRAALTIEPDELGPEERTRLLPEAAAAPDNATPKKKSITAPQIWNATVNALLAENTFLAKYIEPYLYLSKSVPTVLSNLHLYIAFAPAATLPLNPSHFGLAPSIGTDSIPPSQLTSPDNSLYLLSTLPTLTLSLLISAARCTIIHDTSLLNFRIAYAEYASLASKARIASASSGALATGTRVWGREVARGCWEELVKLGLLIPAQGGMGEGVETEVGEKGMVRVDVALEEIAPSCPGMEKGLEKWCRHI